MAYVMLIQNDRGEWLGYTMSCALGGEFENDQRLMLFEPRWKAEEEARKYEGVAKVVEVD